MGSHRTCDEFLGLVLVVLCVLIAGCSRRATTQDPAEADDYQRLVRRQAELDQSVWQNEQQATVHEQAFVALWDALRRDAPRFAEAVRENLDPRTELRWGHIVDWGVTGYGYDRATIGAEAAHPSEGHTMQTCEAVLEQLVDWQRQGYQLVQSEWHHESFQPGTPSTSLMRVTLHVARPPSGQPVTRPLTTTGGVVLTDDIVATEGRWDIRADLHVTWSDRRTRRGLPIPALIDVALTNFTHRAERPVFREAWHVPLAEIRGGESSHDVIAADLDEDGVLEILYPAANRLFRRADDGNYVEERLLEVAMTYISEALVVDMDGDAVPDLFVCGLDHLAPEGDEWQLRWYPGTSDGRFAASGNRMAVPGVHWDSPDSVAFGDIDADGDLDMLVTQYMSPAVDGRLPHPYFDANDGYACHLLVNRDNTTWIDETELRGLGAKRRRRTYRSSFVDLDGDANLDLVVVSDFAGLDVYRNRGQGFFEDTTSSWVDEPANFGMSHTLADFDADGQLDLYVTGMASTTARRLEALGLGRNEYPAHQRMRPRMGYGNRLYYGNGKGQLKQSPRSAMCARAGWSWGCAAFDVQNDGQVDLYVANGHISGRSAADYCTRFWCHDIYAGADHVDSEAVQRQLQVNGTLLGNYISWNGYEKNRLFLNLDQQGFEEVGFLFHVAAEADSRSVISADFDQDGRVDLLVQTADRTRQPPWAGLHLFQNEWLGDQHWIGVIPQGVPGYRLWGAQAVVVTRQGAQRDVLVIGDSFAAQHPARWHFGLGGADQVQAINVTWADGSTSVLMNPAIDRYHRIGLQEP